MTGWLAASKLMGRVTTASGGTLRVDVVEGEFEAACDVCGVRPTSIVVRAWAEDLEALEKTGETGPVERHAFCAEHEGSADAVYHALADA